MGELLRSKKSENDYQEREEGIEEENGVDDPRVGWH